MQITKIKAYLDSLNPEEAKAFYESLKQAKSLEELQEKLTGKISLSEEEMQQLAETFSANQELSDEELSSVAGGCCLDCFDCSKWCPNCRYDHPL